MPLNKSSYLRYQIIDECLTKPSMKYPSSEKILNDIGRILDKSISKETLQKDIHHMKYSADLKFYAPIKYSRRHNGYYYEDPSYSIKTLPIEYDEKESAEFVLAMLNQSGALPFLNKFENFVDKVFTFSKAQSKLKANLSKYIRFEKPQPVEGLNWIEPLVEAMELKQVAKIEYRSIQRKEITWRFIHPYLLKEYNNRWYVFAFDEKSDEERIFGLDRIQGIKISSEKDYKYYKGDLDNVFEHTIGVSRFVGEPEEIVLKFSFPQSEYILTKPIHESQTIVEQDKNSVTIKLFVRINYELKALIRSYGEQVIILKPKELLSR